MCMKQTTYRTLLCKTGNNFVCNLSARNAGSTDCKLSSTLLVKMKMNSDICVTLKGRRRSQSFVALWMANNEMERPSLTCANEDAHTLLQTEGLSIMLKLNQTDPTLLLLIQTIKQVSPLHTQYG